FIASTNLRDNLDAASMRRFDLKIHFAALKPAQRYRLFAQVLKEQAHGSAPSPLWQERLSGLRDLAPGDFAVAVRQQRLRATPMTPESLFEALKAECAQKKTTGSTHGIGFTAKL
ncbi:MAG: ATP-binding protein, partial [Gammaproteobacteria bacterium SHHR-1]